MENNYLELLVGAGLVAWNGWLSLKHFDIEKKYNSLCSNCQFEFKPKIKPPMAA